MCRSTVPERAKYPPLVFTFLFPFTTPNMTPCPRLPRLPPTSKHSLMPPWPSTPNVLGKTEAVQSLIDHCADLNVKCEDMDERRSVKWTPLLVASKNRRLELSRVLLKHGADVNCKLRLRYVSVGVFPRGSCDEGRRGSDEGGLRSLRLAISRCHWGNSVHVQLSLEKKNSLKLILTRDAHSS
jgi:hypothetical protein